MSGVSRSSVVDRNICVFVWYGGFAGDGLRPVGEDFLPSSKSVCSILPIAHHSRAGVSRTWTSHPARRELRLYGVLRSSSEGRATPISPARPTGGYRSLMPVHYLADAILRSIDHRNLERGQLDHDDARPPQVGANRVRAKIFSR